MHGRPLISLALVSLFSVSTSALDYEYGGEFRIRNQNREHTFSNADRRNLIQLRARAQFKVKLENNLSFTMVPQGVKTFGEVISTSNDENDTSRLSSGDQYHSAVDLFEGYVESKGDFFSYKLGRQKLNYGDSVILGTRNWTNGGLSFDAVKGSFQLGEGVLDVAYSKITEGSDNTNTVDDTDLSFLYYRPLMRKNLNLDFYLIRNNERGTLETLSYGTRFKGNWKNIAYRTEVIIQQQSQRDQTEHSFDVEAGYKFNSLKPYIGFTQSSGSYDQLYTNRHRWNGIIDVVGRTNLESLFAGVNYKPTDMWEVKLKYMNFKQKELGVGAYNQATSGIISGDATKEDIGNELDLIVKYNKNKYEDLIVGLSHFSHGDYFSSNPDASSFFYLEYLLKI